MKEGMRRKDFMLLVHLFLLLWYVLLLHQYIFYCRPPIVAERSGFLVHFTIGISTTIHPNVQEEFLEN